MVAVQISVLWSPTDGHLTLPSMLQSSFTWMTIQPQRGFKVIANGLVATTLKHYSYSSTENGYIRLKRVDPSTLDNPELDCKMDESPADGDACQKDDDGKDVTPKAVSVCGTSGVLFDGVLPVGGHLL